MFAAQSFDARADMRGACMPFKKGAHGGNLVSPVKASEPKASEAK
jgi:hypothetical protein